jgi:isochorismate hydrolase
MTDKAISPLRQRMIEDFWGNPQNAKPAKTQVVRTLADDPALKLVSEKSSYMRTER